MCLPVIFSGLISATFSDSVRENAVGPLVRLLVELAVELPHGDALRIENMHVDLCESLIFEVRHGFLKHFIVGSLATSRGSNDHETMSHLCGIVQLNDFVDEGLSGLQIELGISADFIDLRDELSVIDLRF